jgi:DDE family transposase
MRKKIFIMLSMAAMVTSVKVIVTGRRNNATTIVFGNFYHIKGIGLFSYLYDKGIKIIHGLRSNMKNKLISPEEKVLLRRRPSIIETTIGVLKDHLSLEHTRHLSPTNFASHVFSCIISYAFFNASKNLHSSPLFLVS